MSGDKGGGEGGGRRRGEGCESLNGTEATRTPDIFSFKLLPSECTKLRQKSGGRGILNKLETVLDTLLGLTYATDAAVISVATL